MAIILGHGAMAAQRTLNPLIQVRILVPRPSKLDALSTNEEINPDRYSTNQAFDKIQCFVRAFVFNLMVRNSPFQVISGLEDGIK